MPPAHRQTLRADADDRQLPLDHPVGCPRREAAILAEVAPGISHAVVRARLGDVAFLTSRRDHIAGRSAREAYCAQARSVIDGSMIAGVLGIELGMHDWSSRSPEPSTHEAPASDWGEVQGRFRQTLLAWQAAHNGGAYVPAVTLAYAGLSIEVPQIADVALAPNAVSGN